jgi:hypothetical protein
MSYSLNNNFQHHSDAAKGEPIANNSPYLVELDVTLVLIVPVDASSIEDAKAAVTDQVVAECLGTHDYVHLGVVEVSIESVEPAT